MRIALVHDHLLRFGGAERVLKELHAMFPDAPIYTLFADSRVVRAHFPDAEIRASKLDRVPGLRARHRFSLPLIPMAVESFDLRDFDVAVSSVSGFIKGVVTRSHARHLCYCHTPPRFLWEDAEAYRKQHVPRWFSPFAAPLLHGLRLWDQHAAQRVDSFIANSHYTADRIGRYYRRDAGVVAPPVDVNEYPCSLETRKRFALPEEFFLYAAYLDWWKQPNLVVETFNRLDLPLVVVGAGPLEKKLRREAKRNVRFFSWQPDAVLRELMHEASAFIHPQVEDFGMTAVEAMAEGTPVVVFRQGGAVETVAEGISGEFFDDADPIALADAVRRLRESRAAGVYDRKRIRASVQQYAPERFREAIRREVLG